MRYRFIRGVVLTAVLPILLSGCSDSGTEPQAQEPVQLTVAGQVTSEVTGQPLTSASMILSITTESDGVKRNRTERQSVDDEGRYSFTFGLLYPHCGLVLISAFDLDHFLGQAEVPCIEGSHTIDFALKPL